MPESSSEQSFRPYAPIEWGDNLAHVDVHYLGVHNDYLELGAIRPDGSIAMFGELTSGGYDGSRKGFRVSDEAEAAAPGRVLISRAVQSIMELEKLTEAELHPYGEKATQVTPVASAAPATRQIAGLSQTVDTANLSAKLQAITTQPASFTIGGQTMQLSPERIRSWLVVTNDNKKQVSHIYVSTAAMTKSLNELANKYVKSPVNQVVATRGDGSSEVIVTGRNGTQLVNPGALGEQARQTAKTVMDAKGMNFSTELVPLDFQSVTPAAFTKLIEVDVVTKQMYLYEKGNLVRSYPISAGAPETPTPIGQFKIYAKFSKQDMRGDNPDGTRYFQPNVRWINYFLPGGYAVHGNYWRPQSWFGAINSSHGCVSLPDAQAKQVFDWAPIGTTVITHY